MVHRVYWWVGLDSNQQRFNVTVLQTAAFTDSAHLPIIIVHIKASPRADRRNDFAQGCGRGYCAVCANTGRKAQDRTVTYGFGDRRSAVKLLSYDLCLYSPKSER